MPDHDETFLSRWSRRKRALEAETPAARSADNVSAEPVERPPEGQEAAPTAATKDPMLTEADFADVNFEALDFTSDYGRFMRSNVPDAIRNRALRKLWVSDPVLANMDGLHDYFGDYTDAAVAIPAGQTLQTAYKFGQGFLSDDEAAVWDRLGKPVEVEKPREVEVAAADIKEQSPDREQGGIEPTDVVISEVAQPVVPDADDKA